MMSIIISFFYLKKFGKFNFFFFLNTTKDKTELLKSKRISVFKILYLTFSNENKYVVDSYKVVFVI